MKYLLVFLIILNIEPAQAQLLDPYANWFEMESFFNDNEVRKNKIKKLRLEVSHKPDDRQFYDRGEFIEYEFDRSGRMIMAVKRVPMSTGFDSSWVMYRYDSQDRMMEKEERSGPFHFMYQFIHKNDQEFHSLKLRPKENGMDTLYHRTHRIQYTEEHKEEIISNEIGKPFMKRIFDYSSQGQLKESKVIYSFNNNEIKSQFFLEDEKLIGKQYQKDFGDKKNIIWKFSYQENEIELVEVLNKGIISEKIAFTYENDLPSAIVLRNYREKFVRIYKCAYEKY